MKLAVSYTKKIDGIEQTRTAAVEFEENFPDAIIRDQQIHKRLIALFEEVEKSHLIQKPQEQRPS